MTFLVAFGASRPAKLMPLYTSQLTAAGIDYYVEPLQMSSPNDGNLGYCLEVWRKLARIAASFDRIIVTDGWDVLCYGTRGQIAATLATFPPNVIFAAERNCYPEPELAPQIRSASPWRFVNGGMLTASPAELLKWCDQVESHPAYDPAMLGQRWLNRRRAEDSPLVILDETTRLFYCHFLEDGELGVDDGRPYNSLWGTYPAFHHFNGSWPTDSFFQLMNFAENL